MEHSGTTRLPSLLAPDPDAARRIIEFFTSHIRNPHTRKAYALVVPAKRTVTYQDAHARSRPRAQSDLHSYVISDVLH